MKKIAIAMILVISGLVVTPNIYNDVFAQDTNTNIEVKKELTKEEALKLLKEKFNKDLEYIYQGTECDFEALQKEGLTGFVFLPNVPTDMGLFVDKESGDIYYFHPSGYLELHK